MTTIRQTKNHHATSAASTRRGILFDMLLGGLCITAILMAPASAPPLQMTAPTTTFEKSQSTATTSTSASASASMGTATTASTSSTSASSTTMPDNKNDKNDNNGIINDGTSSTSTTTSASTVSTRSLHDDQSDTGNNKKPTLVLHMGPPKTGSTFLQCILTHIKDVLALDNYVYLGLQDYTCSKVEHERQQPVDLRYCFYFFKNRESNDFDPVLLQALEQAYQEGRNVIIANECFEYFEKEQTNNVILALTTRDWHVQIIMNYRRIFEYLPSYYSQAVKPKTDGTGDAAMFVWPGHIQTVKDMNVTGKKLQPFDIDNRPKNGFTQRFVEIEQHGTHPIHTTVNKFATRLLSGSNNKTQNDNNHDNIAILKLHDLQSTTGDAVLTKLFCEVLAPNLPHACAAVQLDSTVAIARHSKNSYYSFNYDILATTAFEKGLFGFHQADENQWPARANVVDKIRRHQEALNKTHHDFDTVCLPQSKLNRILLASLKSENAVYHAAGLNWTANNEAKHRDAFMQFQEKRPYTFCSIDANKTLQNKEWRAFLATL